jgi:8-oxo-dGTP diphosphatase
MMRNKVDERVLEAAVIDARLAVVEFDGARRWLAAARCGPMEPLAAEVWVFDEDLTRVVLVQHRWRGWVPPGGKVEAGETPRRAASRELFEETGLRAELLPEPTAVAVRSYHPDWPVTLGLSYTAVVDAAAPLVAEAGQPAAWMRLDDAWESYFPDDPSRIRQHAVWLAHRVS